MTQDNPPQGRSNPVYRLGFQSGSGGAQTSGNAGVTSGQTEGDIRNAELRRTGGTRIVYDSATGKSYIVPETQSNLAAIEQGRQRELQRRIETQQKQNVTEAVVASQRRQEASGATGVNYFEDMYNAPLWGIGRSIAEVKALQRKPDFNLQVTPEDVARINPIQRGVTVQRVSSIENQPSQPLELSAPVKAGIRQTLAEKQISQTMSGKPIEPIEIIKPDISTLPPFQFIQPTREFIESPIKTLASAVELGGALKKVDTGVFTSREELYKARQAEALKFFSKPEVQTSLGLSAFALAPNIIQFAGGVAYTKGASETFLNRPSARTAGELATVATIPILMRGGEEVIPRLFNAGERLAFTSPLDIKPREIVPYRPAIQAVPIRTESGRIAGFELRPYAEGGQVKFPEVFNAPKIKILKTESGLPIEQRAKPIIRVEKQLGLGDVLPKTLIEARRIPQKTLSLTPIEYTQLLQSRGKLGEVSFTNIPNAPSGEYFISTSQMERNPLGFFQKPSTKVNIVISSKTKNFDTILSHELIHATRLISGKNYESKLPYFKRPSEIEAYALQEKVNQIGFRVKVGGEIITKKYSNIFENPKVLEARKFSVTPSKATKLTEFGFEPTAKPIPKYRIEKVISPWKSKPVEPIKAKPIEISARSGRGEMILLAKPSETSKTRISEPEMGGKATTKPLFTFEDLVPIYYGKTIHKTELGLGLNISPRQGLGITPKIKPIIINEIKPKAMITPKENIISISGVGQSQGQSQGQGVSQGQMQMQSQEISQGQENILRTNARTRQPKEIVLELINPKEEKKKNIFLKKLMGKKRLNKAYNVFVGRGKKERLVGRGLTKGEALRLGSARALKGLEATFSIKESGVTTREDTQFIPNQQIFRGYQIRKGQRINLQNTFIQRMKSRLITKSERSQIKQARQFKSISRGRKSKWF